MMDNNHQNTSYMIYEYVMITQERVFEHRLYCIARPQTQKKNATT